MSNNEITKGRSKRFDFLNSNTLPLHKPKTKFSELSIPDEASNGALDGYEGTQIENYLDQNQSINSEGMIFDDGYYVKSDSVLPIKAKVSHEFSRKSSNQGNANDSKVGKKFTRSGSVRELRTGFGLGIQRFGQRLALTLLVFGIFFVLLASGITAWGINQYNNAPNITESSLFNIKESSVMYASDSKTKIFEFYDDGKREYVTIDKIPEVMQLAVLGLEDENFYYNDVGIPWSNIAGAFAECAKNGFKDCRGGSGISQQLVKNVTDQRGTNVDRKVTELFTAIKLYNEGTKKDGKKVNKSDILELYLNWVLFGRNSYGVQQASVAFFGHKIDARQNEADPSSPYLLTPAKACYLAALVQKPGYFPLGISDPASLAFKEYSARKDACLEKLSGDGKNFSIRGEGKGVFLNSDELAAGKAEQVQFASTKFDDPFPHFREYAQGEIVKYLESIGLSENDLYSQGLKIVTSLDPAMQKQTEETLKNSKPKVLAAGGDNAAAIVLDGPTGQIKAMVGSLDYNDDSIQGKVNVTTTPQQPGSSMKPYVYTNAFDKGFNPGTVLMDTKTNFGSPQTPYYPNNFAKDFRGPTTIHYALSNSRNIPAIKAGLIGAGTGPYDPQKSLNAVFDFAESVGARFPCQPVADGADKCNSTAATGENAAYRDRCGISSFIGSCEITPLSHATGINTLLQEGNLRTATPFVSIIDKNGQELFSPDKRQTLYPTQDAKIKPTIAKEIEWIMSDQNRQEFFQFQPLFTIPGWKLAAKTGTTDNNTDTFMVGGSPYYTTVVWAGRTDNKPMHADVQASNLAAPIWQDIQKNLLKDKEVKAFDTSGLTEVKLDPYTGFPSSSGTVQLLNDDQIQLLKDAGSKVAKPSFNPAASNMYETRSAIIERNFKFNKLDGKLAVDGKTMDINVEERRCYLFLAEFPGLSNWRESVEAWGASSGLPKCADKYDNSNQDQVNNPGQYTNSSNGNGTDSANLAQNQTPTFKVNDPISLRFQASGPISGQIKIRLVSGTTTANCIAQDYGKNQYGCTINQPNTFKPGTADVFVDAPGQTINPFGVVLTN